MILINDEEILLVGDGMTWEGDKETVSRTLSFSVLYVPTDINFPKYKIKAGDKVEWIENNKTLFLGYIENIDYSTDNEMLNISCIDLMVRLLKSKCIGRFQGTLTELANNICGLFGLTNGIESDSTHKHNIISDGNMSYYDVLNTACKSMFDRYCLYLEGNILKLATNEIKDTFEMGLNIRASSFSQDLSELVTKVLIIDNEGHLLDSVQDDENLKQFGLFQEVYNFNKDSKNNIDEARKLLQGVINKGVITVNNNNNCIAGSYIKVVEPINNFVGTFEIVTDSHTIATDSNMTLEIENVANK